MTSAQKQTGELAARLQILDKKQAYTDSQQPLDEQVIKATFKAVDSAMGHASDTLSSIDKNLLSPLSRKIVNDWHVRQPNRDLIKKEIIVLKNKINQAVQSSEKKIKQSIQSDKTRMLNFIHKGGK